MNEYVLVLGLDHIVSLGSQAGHVAVNVNGLFVLDAFQHRVNDDEAASSADSSAAVDDQWSAVYGIQSSHATQELQEWSWVLGHSVIRPSRELELLDLSSFRVSVTANLKFEILHCETILFSPILL